MTKRTIEPHRVHAGDTADSKQSFYSGTRAEVAALVRAQPAGTRFLVYVEGAANDAQGDDFDSRLSVSVQLSRVAMLNAIKSCIRDSQETRGARIPVSVYESGKYRAFYLF